MAPLDYQELNFRYEVDHALNNMLGTLDIRVLEIGYTANALPWTFLDRHFTSDPWYRIYYMDNQSGFLQLENQLVELSPGYLHLLPAHLYFRYDTAVLPSHLWVHFFSDKLQQFLPCQLYSLPFDNQELLQRVLNSIRHGRTDTPHRTIEHNSLCRQLLDYFLEHKDFLVNVEKNDIPLNLRRAVEYIHQNSQRELSIGELAKVAMLPPSQFSLQFSKYYGMSPKSYCCNMRINQAKILLMQTNLTTKEVADRCGFLDCYYFYRTFKAHVGYTPSQYRSLNKTKH